jgi:hypothetical protein
MQEFKKRKKFIKHIYLDWWAYEMTGEPLVVYTTSPAFKTRRPGVWREMAGLFATGVAEIIGMFSVALLPILKIKLPRGSKLASKVWTDQSKWKPILYQGVLSFESGIFHRLNLATPTYHFGEIQLWASPWPFWATLEVFLIN